MIELKNIKKKYQDKVIFEDVNLTLCDAMVTALIGHNGCGKSTMLKVASGLIRPDRGEIHYEKKYRFAYVPEKFPAINMSARAYLMHMAEIDGLYGKAESMERINTLAKDFFLEGMLDKPMKNLSKGTLQKIGVIQAFMSDPEVLLLDEPLSGQDVDSQDVFIDKVKKVKEQGTIVLLSAHEPELIHALADQVYTIRDSRLIPYELSPRTRYMIWIAQDESKTPEKEMKPSDNGYIVVADERNLPLEIKRLQKEGWHIGKVYEECSND